MSQNEEITEEKAISLRQFLTIYHDITKALDAMRRKCEHGDNFVCGSYKDQMLHYTKMMLRTESAGEREPVISIMRRLGEPEFNTAQEIQRVWEVEKKEHPEFVKKEGQVREFVAKKVEDYWLEQMAGWIGKDRMDKVKEIERGIHVGAPPPPKPKPEAEAEELEKMKKKLEERIKELRK